jgi:hypothetical protein
VIGCALVSFGCNENEDEIEIEEEVTSKNKMDNMIKFDQVRKLLACVLVDNFYASRSILLSFAI